MTGMREDLERRLHHQQPRTWHVDATTPGFTHPDTNATTCPNPHCVGGRVDATTPAATHPAAQTDTACPICDGIGERSTS